MRFVADEGVDLPVVQDLRKAGHEVHSILEGLRGESDEKVLETANRKEAILITEDKDFGELVFRMKKVHFGVILLRLSGLDKVRKSELVVNSIQDHSSELPFSFTVITDKLVRIRKG